MNKTYNMSMNYRCILIESALDARLNPEDRSDSESTIEELKLGLPSVESALLVCGSELECIHLASIMKIRLNLQMHISHNLSRAIEGQKACDPSELRKFNLSSEDFVETPYERRVDTIHPQCRCPEIFLKAFSDKYETIIMVMTSELSSQLEISKFYSSGRFTLAGPFQMIESIMVEDSMPIVSRVPIDNVFQKNMKRNEILLNQMQRELENLEMNSPHNIIETSNRCLRKIHTLNNAVSALCKAVNERTSTEDLIAQKTIQIEQFHYNDKDDLWEIRIYNNSDVPVRNVRVINTEDESELCEIKLIEPFTSVKKYIEMQYSTRWFYNNLIAKKGNRPVSVLYCINPIEIKQIRKNEFLVKNNSNWSFESLNVMISGQTKEVQMVKSPDFFEKKVFSLKNYTPELRDSFIYLESNDGVVSNSIIIK